jgi:hypothetical protein
LAQAEREGEELKCRQADEVGVIKGELAALAQKLKDAERAHVIELKAAEGQLQDQEALYQQALRAWEGS